MRGIYVRGIYMKPELLAPAGSAAKLETALRYGADAVYVSDKRYGLRAFADNFTVGGIEEAAARVHACGKKIYVTVNIYAGDGDLGGIPEYARSLEKAGADGAIISDLGVFSLFREAAPSLELHVSTQANVTNSAAAKAWAAL